MKPVRFYLCCQHYTSKLVTQPLLGWRQSEGRHPWASSSTQDTSGLRKVGKETSLLASFAQTCPGEVQCWYWCKVITECRAGIEISAAVHSETPLCKCSQKLEGLCSAELWSQLSLNAECQGRHLHLGLEISPGCCVVHVTRTLPVKICY